jgi:purine catabolism regulator
VSAVAGIPDSCRDATVAARRAELDGGPRIADFADLDLIALLLGEAEPERIRPKADELLAPLRDNAALRAALEAYFAHGLDVMSAARALHVHHNTLRYRLGRVEEALGRPLRDPATIALLYVALAAEGSAPAGEGS